MGPKLVMHTFRMVFRNLGQALRISVGPYLLLVLALWLFFRAAGLSVVADGVIAPQDQGSGAALFWVFPVLVLLILVPCWVAVAWHRFVLLEENAGLLPRFDGKAIRRYLGKVVVLILGLVIVGVVAMLLLGTIASVGSITLVVILQLVLLVALGYLWLRLGLVLPGAAVGAPIDFAESWEETGTIGGDILIAMLVLAVIWTVLDFVSGAIAGVVPMAGLILDVALTWLNLMVGISLLTTLYGYLVEKRPIPD